MENDKIIENGITETKIIKDDISSTVEIPKRTYKKREETFKSTQFVEEFRSLEEIKEYIENSKNIIPYYIYNDSVSLKHPMVKFTTIVFKTVEKCGKLSCEIIETSERFEKFVNELQDKKILGISEEYLKVRFNSDLRYLIITEETTDKTSYVAKNVIDRNRNSLEVLKEFIKSNSDLEVVYMSARGMKPIRRSAQTYLVIFKK